MTSKIDPNLSRLKCIGYKYGYDDAEIHHIPELLPYSGIAFIKYLSGKIVDFYDIKIPFETIEEYKSNNNFDIIANYVEEYLKQSTELDKHYV